MADECVPARAGLSPGWALLFVITASMGYLLQGGELHELCHIGRYFSRLAHCWRFLLCLLVTLG